VRFDWDPLKSARNEAKHGISLAEARVLWNGDVVTLPSRNPGEPRHLAIGLIEGRYWTVIYALRDDHLRLISARRSRKNEEKLHQKAVGQDSREQP
jgi:uncharacterized protein